jgi:hypothetical protein
MSAHVLSQSPLPDESHARLLGRLGRILPHAEAFSKKNLIQMITLIAVSRLIPMKANYET